jgi:hypothetical protein
MLLGLGFDSETPLHSSCLRSLECLNSWSSVTILYSESNQSLPIKEIIGLNLTKHDWIYLEVSARHAWFLFGFLSLYFDTGDGRETKEMREHWPTVIWMLCGS